MKLGSLFDGSGGFPLAGMLNGIEPRWLAEIEPYPCRVTAKRFPCIPNHGDVTKISGAEIEPVDIVTFGSPCQDLSVAGKQAGIHEGARSSLFFEAVRIIKEMRDATSDHYPRFAVWENVPGAFSSNRGEDFRAVLRALCEIKDPGAAVPEPPRGGWKHAGCIVGNGYSIAWRVYDAQYWGVPQRRKRIYLIADFGSERAGEILFEPESVSGDSAEGGEAGQGAPCDAERSVGGSDNACGCDLYNGQLTGDKMATINANSGASANHAGPSVIFPINTMVATRGGKDDMRTCFGIGEPGDPQFTISAAHEHGVCYLSAFMGGQGPKARSIGYRDDGTTPTLMAAESGSNRVPDVCYSIEGHIIDRRSGQNGCGWAEGYAHTLNATDHHGVCYAPEGNFCGGYSETNISATLETRYHYGSGGDAAMMVYPIENHGCYPEIARSLCARADSSPCVDRGQNIVCYDARGNGEGGVCPTITGDHENRITDYTAICVGNGQTNQSPGTVAGASNCMHDQQAVVYPGVGITSPQNGSNPQPGDPAPSLTNDNRNYLVQGTKPLRKYIVRRLTPLECCRLQGFPDWWEDGAEGSDSARYKMWGNGIALPCAADVLRRIAKEGGTDHVEMAAEHAAAP